MIDVYDIPPKFYNDKDKPIAHTVKELRRLLIDLPDDLPTYCFLNPELGTKLLVMKDSKTDELFLDITQI